MSEKNNTVNFNIPVESHIMSEGKMPSSDIKFKRNKSESVKEIRPIIIKWKSQNNFVHIFS